VIVIVILGVTFLAGALFGVLAVLRLGISREDRDGSYDKGHRRSRPPPPAVLPASGWARTTAPTPPPSDLARPGGVMNAHSQSHASTGGSRPGIVAAAVLRAACLSARMSEAFIARTSGVSEHALQSWADGTRPLASVPVPRLERLEAALLTAGAEPALVADLATAAWCDLVLEAIAADEDTTALLADPAASSDAFSELLAWAVTGRVPARYLSHSPAGRLLADPAAADRAIKALKMTPRSPGRPRTRCPNRNQHQRPERFPHCHRRS